MKRDTTTRRVLAVFALLAVLGAGFGAGWAAASIGHHPPGPRPCTLAPGVTVASGDAWRETGGLEQVCTDGTWVHITGQYGNN